MYLSPWTPGDSADLVNQQKTTFWREATASTSPLWRLQTIKKSGELMLLCYRQILGFIEEIKVSTHFSQNLRSRQSYLNTFTFRTRRAFHLTSRGLSSPASSLRWKNNVITVASRSSQLSTYFWGFAVECRSSSRLLLASLPRSNPLTPLRTSRPRSK